MAKRVPGKLKQAEDKLREYMIAAVLVKHDGNRKAAAKELGITTAGLGWNIRRLAMDESTILRKASEMGQLIPDASRPKGPVAVASTKTAAAQA